MADERILVVDDETSLLELVQSILEDDGYNVLLASDGIEGLEIIRGEHPDLVITDVAMPRMDGFELVRRVRSEPVVGTVPLVILSAHAEEEKKVKGLDLGADDYITKPFGQRELLAKIRAILRRRDMLLHGKVRSGDGPFDRPGLDHLRSLRFDNFIVGVGNRTAFEGSKLAAEDLGRRFNPLFIYGEPGLGKTHLMCAFANEIYEQHRDRSILYITSEVFSQQILEAYQERRVDALRREYLLADLLLIDDIQFLGISPSLQTVAADILSQMYDKGRQIIITSDRKPEHLQTLVDEISNELSVGLVVRVDHPDASLRGMILKSKARQRKWNIEDEMLDYLAGQMDCDIRTLDGTAKRLVAMKSLADVDITFSVIDDLIREIGIPADISSRPDEIDGEAPIVEIGTEDTSSLDAEPSFPPTAFDDEFSPEASLVRLLDTPSRIADSLPPGDPIPVFVTGSASAQVIDTLEALAGITHSKTELPEGDDWIYMIHRDRVDPDWLLLGFSNWSDSDDGMPDNGYPTEKQPILMIILDGMSPRIMEARRIVKHLPDGCRVVVIVLVAVMNQYSTAGVSDLLTQSMRRLFRIPEEIPMIISASVGITESREWMRQARSLTGHT